MNRPYRLLWVAFSVFGLFALLLMRYFTLQIVQYPLWSAKAAAQHEIIVKEPFRRGTFYADVSKQPGQIETGRPLVLDVPKYHLFIDPLAIAKNERDNIFQQLQIKINMSEETRQEFEKPSHCRCLMRWLNHHQKREVLDWWLPYARQRRIPSNALYFASDYKRSYPYGALFGQALHTIQELKEQQTDQAVPTGGLESYFNDLLKGKVGKRKLLRSPRHRLDIDQLILAPEEGADIYLTINPFIQAIAEKALEKGVIKAQAKGGWVVIMEAHSGHIIALAHYPSFDPSTYRNYFNDPIQIENTKVHAVSDAFEIGSIMKPITLAIALRANRELQSQGKSPLFDPEAKMNVTRTVFPGRASKPLKDLQTHRALNMAMALQKSSNIYMAQLADLMVQQLGSDWYRTQLVHTFGFESKTGIELPAEAIGCVPSKNRLHPNGAPEWSLPTPYSLAMGYNLLATGIQMVRAYAIFANGGYLVDPTLVKKIVRGKEELVWKKSQRKQVLDPRDAQKILEVMKYTTKEGGTGVLASIPGYTEAGKTGSAEKLVNGQYAKNVHLSSFIGIMPANIDSPDTMVALVSIDEPAPILQENGRKGYLGGRCAAPVFCEVMRKTAEVLGIPPDDPYGYVPGDPRHDSSRADWVSEVVSLKKLYNEWNFK